MFAKGLVCSRFIARYWVWFLFLLILLLHSFLRFYQIEIRNPFGWDQVDNAWMAKNIIVEHRFPLVGMQAKLNSGFYIGPLYYYLVSVAYFLTNLDPIASGIFSGITSLFNLLVLFYIAKKLFSFRIALFAVYIYTASFFLVVFDRTQWPVNLIISSSLIIFYSLYNVLTGNEKYLLLLAAAAGFFFNLHFTSVFIPVIVFLSLPFFPRTKNLIKYGLLSIPLSFAFIAPVIIADFASKASSAKSLTTYINTYYLGFHLKRVMQVANDGFIEFQSLLESVVQLKNLFFLKFIFLPVFCLVYYFSNKSQNRLIFCYLTLLWFLIPWLGFSLYKGEISNYYFTMTLPIAIIILAYLSVWLFLTRFIFLKIFIVFFWLYYSIINIYMFFNTILPEEYRLSHYRKIVSNSIREGCLIEFQEGVPQSYIYYISTRK